MRSKKTENRVRQWAVLLALEFRQIFYKNKKETFFVRSYVSRHAFGHVISRQFAPETGGIRFFEVAVENRVDFSARIFADDRCGQFASRKIEVFTLENVVSSWNTYGELENEMRKRSSPSLVTASKRNFRFFKRKTTDLFAYSCRWRRTASHLRLWDKSIALFETLSTYLPWSSTCPNRSTIKNWIGIRLTTILLCTDGQHERRLSGKYLVVLRLFHGRKNKHSNQCQTKRWIPELKNNKKLISIDKQKFVYHWASRCRIEEYEEISPIRRRTADGRWSARSLCSR